MGGPLRVLHVVVNMNRGGAETLIMNLYRNIERSKVQFDFLTCKEGEFDQEILGLGGKIHRIPYITNGGHFNYIKNLNQFFKNNNNYKIVHSHMDKMSGLVLKAAKKAMIPVRIAHSHSTRSEGKYLKRVYKWYVGKNIVKDSTHLIACSKAAAEWLFFKQIDNVSYLQNGIDTEKFGFSSEIRKHVRNELNISDNCLVIGHVGSFTEPKNQLFILDIFNEYIKTNQNSLLVLTGDGPLKNMLEVKAKKLKLQGKVKFLGTRSDIHRLLQAFDIFVFPSLYEGLPLTLIEAQGAGLPCLISENITEEVDMGLDLLKFLSLTKKQSWLEEIKIISTKNITRNIPKQALAEQGYDIRNKSIFIKNFYLESAR